MNSMTVNDNKNNVSGLENEYEIIQSKPYSDMKSSSFFSLIQSLTRLTIGGLVIGYEIASERLQKWESLVDEELIINNSKSGQIEIVGDEVSEQTIASNEHEEIIEEINNPPSVSGSVIVFHELPADSLKYPAVGLLFHGQNIIREGIRKVDHSSRKVSNTIVDSLSRFSFFTKIDKRFNDLVSRGNVVLQPLAEKGRMEYKRSRVIAEKAYSDTYQDVLNTLSESEEVQNLIQDQSVGLASEVVEEMRERSVSADDYIDSLLRRILKKKPRDYYVITEYFKKDIDKQKDVNNEHQLN